MKRRSAQDGCRPWVSLGITLVWLLGSARAESITVSGRVTYEVPEGIYIDAGKDQGLQQGLAGTLRLDDGRMFQFEVLHVASKSSLLRLTGRPDGQERLVGRTAEVIFESSASAAQATGRGEGKTSAKEQPASEKSSAAAPDKGFVPLLAPIKTERDYPRTQDVFHGRAQVRRMMQTDSEGHDYSRTLLDSAGSIERIRGSGWGFEWSGNLSYRDGAAMQASPDYQEPRLDLYMASLQHPWGEGGFLRAGRFLPHELPAIGYVDGFQGERRWSDHVRVGALAGLKPGRQDLAATADEPLATAYTTVEAGRRDSLYYSGTAGLLGSLYKGRADRLSLLVDQRAGTGPRLTAYSTAQVDFDTGSAQARTGARLTRLDTFVVSRLNRVLTLRAGVDHWERPDRLAERASLPLVDDRFFDSGYWRYWVGSQQNLPWRLQLSEEVALISASEGDTAPRWQVGMTRTGLLGWTQASSTVTLYNLEGAGSQGYGVRFSSFLPVLNNKLIIQPEAGFRMLDTDAQSDALSLTYLALRLDGRFSRRWTLFGGFTHTTTEGQTTNLLDLGIRYTW